MDTCREYAPYRPVQTDHDVSSEELSQWHATTDDYSSYNIQIMGNKANNKLFILLTDACNL